MPTTTELQRIARDAAALEVRERHLDETVWAADLPAQAAGRVFEALWDGLNAAADKWAVVEAFACPRLIVPGFKPAELLPHGIECRAASGAGSELSAPAWKTVLAGIRAAGWRLMQVELRHHGYTPAGNGKGAVSRFAFAANLTREPTTGRASLRGELVVDWAVSAAGAVDAPPVVEQIDARGLTLLVRPGGPAFETVLNESITPFPKTPFIDPLIVRDLDGDGRAELILASRNLIYRPREGGGFESGPLCADPPGLIFTGVVADFDGDGHDDFLCARFDGLHLYRGSPQGTFDRPGELVWSADPRLKYAQVLTCGDVDGDGDLDVWLGQYKGPYDRGQMPTPYYDANDGYPSYLLRNDGHGHLADVTVESGLAAKRNRRSYSGSLVDLDGDGDLDLVVVSDFAGVDAYANDGHGRFSDVTKSWLPEPHAFGMAHTLADFDGDGRLDLLVMGMECPTPQRLDALGLSRPDRPDYAAMRGRMTAGNRLYVGRPGGGFGATPLNASIAHSGWSWGVSTADFDNDGRPDVFVANGHESKRSVADYEGEFWRHDIYVGQSRDNAVAAVYFGTVGARTRGQGQSYGGYEKNRLFWNRDGHDFLEIGHLLGVALEEDSRCVVTEDVDGDGRIDLLVTTFEVWPAVRQTLKVFRNQLPDTGHWIGIRLNRGGFPAADMGAVVTVTAGDRVWRRSVVTGDSHRAQHAAAVHFGLGGVTNVSRAEVKWPDGRTTILDQPPVDRWLRVTPPLRR